MKALLPNAKTYKSLDLSTNCPKRAEGNPCSYCYVESARKKGFRAKKVSDRCEYNNEILTMRQPTIDKLNQCGGLRLFSFGDYMPWMDDQLDIIIEQAQKRNLKLKVITKIPEFVVKYHSKFDIINISVDAIGEGADHDIVRKLKEEYSNVKIRAAIMKDEDVETLNWVDILTFNHANNGYHMFSKDEVLNYNEKYPGKVCCVTGKCLTCNLKCGLEE